MSQQNFQRQKQFIKGGLLLLCICIAGPAQQIGEAQIGEAQNADKRAVAFVNGEPILASAVELRQRLISESQQWHQNQSKDRDPKTLARKQLIEEAVLLQAAESERVSVTDGEIAGTITAMQRAASESSDPQIQNAFTLAAEQLGLLPENFAGDPRVIKIYRKLWIVSAMRRRIAETIPAQERDYASVQIAIDRFVAERSDWVSTRGLPVQ